MDICDPSVTELIERRAPEVVFHLAAQIDVRVSVSDPALDARDQRDRHASTCWRAPVAPAAARSCSPPSGGTIYGDVGPRGPAGRPRPTRSARSRPTACPRRSATDYLHAYRELHQLEYTSLALANVYGPRQDPHGEAGVVAIFAGAARGRALHGVRHRRADPRLRLRRRRRRRVRPGGGSWQRPAVQHRHRDRDLGQRAVPLHGRQRRRGGRTRSTRPPGWASSTVPAWTPRAPSSTWAGSRSRRSTPARRPSSTGSARRGPERPV